MKTFKEYSNQLDERCWKGYKPVPGKKPFSKGSCTKEELDYDIELYDLDEEFEYTHSFELIDEENEITEFFIIAESDEDAETMMDLIETAAWQRKEGKSQSGGLNKKGVASYRKQHPGSKLKTAVTTPPSKLKKGSKSAKRRKSFCARMKGMKKRLTGAKKSRDPNSRINKSLRKWNCR